MTKLFILSNNKNRQRGFTLIEMIIYVSLLSLLLLVLTDIFTSSLDVRLESQSFSSVEQDSRFITTRLTYDLHRAQNISIPANIGDQGSIMQITIDGNNYSYDLSNNNLTINSNLGTNQLNSYNTRVSALSFKRVGNPGGKNDIIISFTLSSISQKTAGPATKNISLTAGIR
ncbi:prepilin-type N-terminal cleavage/methylation domain-containing protein [Patescibacteria group bacterium]|nr:prepilin-type N-terminal cleavage/methylation domain-containing protein [Patescibacteria group bacterium]MCL5798107.1 prepilin-type N-terminal cleavage/methylation domain-containing protein [Patescibacteria group bacterium]